jgi:hypothetical protein
VVSLAETKIRFYDVSEKDRLLETADMPSTMIVGVHLVADETLRLHLFTQV